MFRLNLCSLLLVAALSSQVVAEDWGHLKGRFVFDGDAPTANALSITKDVEVCGKLDLKNESLRVNGENGGVADVIVYMYLSRKDKKPTIHPSYDSTAKAQVNVDNTNCRFEPHVTLLRTGQTLVIGNKDTVGHNTKVDTVKNAPINPIVPANGQLEHVFGKAERLPTSISCSIHPWMTGKLVIKDNPYMAVTDKDGNFTIENLPAGEWTFQVWQEAAGYVTEANQGGKKVKWKKGRFTHTVKAGDNDLGEMKLSASVFKK